MFMELVSFARDGATNDQITEIIRFLSIMQYLAEASSDHAAKPVRMPEFRQAVQRAIRWFKTSDSDDSANQQQVISKWLESMERRGEPVIWAWVTHMLKNHGILQCALAEEMVITIYAVADVYSRRLAKAK
jgi:FixJ family two-component response regulator